MTLHILRSFFPPMLLGWEFIVRPLSLIFTNHKSGESGKPSVVGGIPIRFSPRGFIPPLGVDFFIRVFILGILLICLHIVLVDDRGVWLRLSHQSSTHMIELVQGNYIFWTVRVFPGKSY